MSSFIGQGVIAPCVNTAIVDFGRIKNDRAQQI